MLQSFTSHLFILLFISLLHPRLPCNATRPTPGLPLTGLRPTNNYNNNNYTWKNFKSFLNAEKGSCINGMSQLKRYFHHFGYFPSRELQNITDTFDSLFESAIVRYQAKLGLRITGKLDYETLNQIISPRCGVPDIRLLHAQKNYMYFLGTPRWSRHLPTSLTYAFSHENMIHYLNLSDIKEVFKLAFAKWGSVIPVSFIETEDYGFADIKIGFYSGDHGDGEPFDGVLGVLAHSFSPESGKFHLDAAETWAVDFRVEKSRVAVDLESVAVHEIGHLLGLAHSSVKEAVMYPSLKPRKRKVDLSVDDIEGVQALYGSNPNFTIGSLLESDISTNQAIHFNSRTSQWAMLIVAFVLCLCV